VLQSAGTPPQSVEPGEPLREEAAQAPAACGRTMGCNAVHTSALRSPLTPRSLSQAPWWHGAARGDQPPTRRGFKWVGGWEGEGYGFQHCVQMDPHYGPSPHRGHEPAEGLREGQAHRSLQSTPGAPLGFYTDIFTPAHAASQSERATGDAVTR